MNSFSVAAADSRGWAGEPYVVSREKSNSIRYLPFYCGGDVAQIQVAGEITPQHACVFGKVGAFRMAQYLNNQGKIQLLASYALDRQFYVVRDILCGYEYICVYSQASDTLLTGLYNDRLLAYDNLSRMLRSRFDPSVANYYFTTEAQVRAVNEAVGVNLPLGRVAISRNGKWAAVEYRGLGLIRLNVTSGEQRRVATLSTRDRNNFAITDDGKAIAVGNEQGGARLFTVDATCGDRPAREIGEQFPPYVRTCPEVPLDISRNFPYFYSAERPYFFDDDRLYYLVTTSVGSWDVVYSSGPPPATGIIDYVALGDSFTSGEGEASDAYYLLGTNNPPHNCHLSNRSYPYALLQIPLMGEVYGTKVLSVACSGAVMADITNNSEEYTGQGGRIAYLDSAAQSSFKEEALALDKRGIIPQLSFVKKYQPRQVTIGIGGNDAGFMNKLKSCVAPGVCEWAREGPHRSAIAREIDALHERLKEMIHRVKKSANTTVRVIGYPQIISDERDVSCGLVLGMLLSYEERIFMARSISRLNSAIRRAAHEAEVEYVSVEDAYVGHRLCESTQSPAMNGVRFGDDFSPIATLSGLKLLGAESFHPTAFGHQLVAQQIAQYHNSATHGLRTDSFTTDETYWRADPKEEGFRYVLLHPDLRKYSRGDGAYQLTIPKGMFMPNSKISVYYQNSSIEHTFMVGLNGGFEGELVLPEYQSGVYAIYIKGVTPSNELISAYTMIEYSDGSLSEGVDTRSEYVNSSNTFADYFSTAQQKNTQQVLPSVFSSTPFVPAPIQERGSSSVLASDSRLRSPIKMNLRDMLVLIVATGFTLCTLMGALWFLARRVKKGGDEV
ncbi:SGNH/GDSL hydrolase family protein [Candidatus Saccharibacteria bacterium TM7i]|nr:SGNH/GDSL hydrolase family protein [Candidatus Saccharibacteria bacterium TM7i]